MYLHASGAKRVQHPVVGRLEMLYDSMGIAAVPGLTLQVYTAEPGSSTSDALRLLGSWAAEQVPVEQGGADEHR